MNADMNKDLSIHDLNEAVNNENKEVGFLLMLCFYNLDEEIEDESD